MLGGNISTSTRNSDLSLFLLLRSIFCVFLAPCITIQLGQEKERAIQNFLSSRGLNVEQMPGQRRCGPPPSWGDKPVPDKTEVFIDHMPTDCYEDELVPYLEQFGTVYETRICLGPNEEHRGFGYAKFATREEMQKVMTWAERIRHAEVTSIANSSLPSPMSFNRPLAASRAPRCVVAGCCRRVSTLVIHGCSWVA